MCTMSSVSESGDMDLCGNSVNRITFSKIKSIKKEKNEYMIKRDTRFPM